MVTDKIYVLRLKYVVNAVGVSRLTALVQVLQRFAQRGVPHCAVRGLDFGRHVLGVHHMADQPEAGRGAGAAVAEEVRGVKWLMTS